MSQDKQASVKEVTAYDCGYKHGFEQAMRNAPTARRVTVGEIEEIFYTVNCSEECKESLKNKQAVLIAIGDIKAIAKALARHINGCEE